MNTNAVHIIDTAVCGISAFHAYCPSCGYRCHRQAHTTEAQAVRCASRHNTTAH